MRQRFIAPFVAIILSIIVVGFYARSLSFAFLGDDLGIVEMLYKLALKGELWRQVGSDFASTMFDFNGNFYRPLVVATFALDYTLWGANPFGYHLTNLLLHLSNTLLLYAIVLALVPRSIGWSRYLMASVAALCFALRPVVSEVALWISGRGDSLALLGMLVAVYGYLRANGRWNSWYWVAVGGFVFSLLSKEPAAILPAALVGLHLFGFVVPKPDGKDGKASWQAWLVYAIRSLAPFTIITVGYFVWRWVLFGSFTKVYNDTPPVEWNLLWLRVKVAALHYMLIPHLLPGWDKTVVTIAIIGIAVLVVLIAIRSTLSRRLLGFGTFWLAAIILPALPQLYINRVGEGERLLYIPAIPLAIIITSAIPLLSNTYVSRYKRLLNGLNIALLCCIVCISTLWQWQRLNEWVAVSDQLKTMTTAIREEAATVPNGQTHLLLTPGNIQGIFFARSGQGALMSPPIQPYPVYGSIFVYSSERPCEPPTVDLGLPITEVKCWNVQTQQFEPFDMASYDSATAPIYWYLDPTLRPFLESNP